MQSPWKVIFALIGVFVAGVVFGGVFTLAVTKMFRAELRSALAAHAARLQPPSEPSGRKAAVAAPQSRGIQPAIMRQLTQRLNPTPEQQKAIRQIVGRAQEDWQRMGREHIADIARVLDRMYEDVSALLSPEQRLQLDQMRQEMLERARKEREKRTRPEPSKDKEGANLPGPLPRPVPTGTK